MSFKVAIRDGQTVRLTIGEPIGGGGRGIYTIPEAQEQARRLQRLIDEGKDPRRERIEQEASDRAARAADRATRRRREVSGLMAWDVYCAERRSSWSERNHADHLAFSSEGGKQRKRSTAKTIAGPLRPLLAQPLAEIDAALVQKWVVRETKVRPARALLGFRLLRAFLNWCAESDDYRALAQPDACKGKRVREKLGKPGAKTDALQREQLAAWFRAVRLDGNPVASAYLQTLLLTGARREELAGLQWEQVDLQWKALIIRDKVEGERTIPLTAYVGHLLSLLPRRPSNPFVFTSTGAANGRLQDARSNHTRALKLAGLPHVTLHGLRRSFGTLAEWVNVPVGVVAQIQGHKPSAIAEKHYRVRPLDMLRMHHQRVEAWILAQAGVTFEASAAPTVP
jgi:integrase